MEFLAWGLAFSCFFWVLYIALEPYVRRRWPATLVSWSRLLAGGFRDPLVGRDVLVGCLAGAFVERSCQTGVVCSLLARRSSGATILSLLRSSGIAGLQSQFLGARTIIADISSGLILALVVAFVSLFVLFLFRALLRKEWAAAVAFVLLFAVLRTQRGAGIPPSPSLTSLILNGRGCDFC